MQIVTRIFTLLVAGLILYFSAWPVPVLPVAWQAEPSLGYTMVHASNTRLSCLRRIELHGHVGPEHVAIGPDGLIYAAVEGGHVLRMREDGSDLIVFASTGGRVLGFDFDVSGRLIAADAVLGLLSIDGDGSVRVLADEFNGLPLRYVDAVVVASDGKIYFTDASQRFSPRDWGGTFEACLLDLLENSATGRVLMFDPLTDTVQLVAGGLSFPNGIVMTQDGQNLLVVETGRYRVWRIAVLARNVDFLNLEANSSPSIVKIVLSNLPGYPDNLMRGLEGRIWLGLVKPRTALLDTLAPYPFARTIAARLPRSMLPVPKPYGHVIAFKEDGQIVADLQDPSGVYPETTAVTETNIGLFVQSLHASWLGWLPRADMDSTETQSKADGACA
jgi:sugar lactone lactonase YvrE